MRYALLLLTAAAGLVRAEMVCTESASAITLANQHLKLSISKSRSVLTSLQLDGVELLGNGGQGYLDVNDTFGAWSLGNGTTLYALRHTRDFCDVAITHQADGQIPITLTLHYVLTAKEQGFHQYSVYAHMAGQPPDSIGQTRTVLRADPALFDHHFSEPYIRGIMPLPADVAANSGNGDLQDATYDLTPFHDAAAEEYKSALGKWAYTKYDWSGYLKRHAAHGIYGARYGLWILCPSLESMNGGPTKQNLLEHQTNTTPVLLNEYVNGHYSQSTSLAVAGDFQKTFGPFFVYVSQSDAGPLAMYNEALGQLARRDEFRALYGQLGIPGAPAEQARATVTGQIVLAGGLSMAGATVLLTDDGVPFDQHVQGYQYWTEAGADGRFTMTGVLPGVYRLSGYKAGIFDDFHQDHVQISAPGTVLAAQTWTLPIDGTTVLQIGLPDRTAIEFNDGERFKNYGLFNDYVARFGSSGGVHFQFGASRERDDWYFVQWRNITPNHPAGPTVAVPDYEALFTLAKAPASGAQALLTVAVAGQSSAGTLTPTLNGVAATGWAVPYTASVATRSGASGIYSSHVFTFPGTALRQGQNSVKFHISGSGGYLLYDAVRLSVTPADPTLAPQPDLSVSNTPIPGATAFQVVVKNVGVDASRGPVTVGYTLPGSLQLASMTGDGWTCSSAGFVTPEGFAYECTRSDSLNAGASYPVLLVNASVISPEAPGATTLAVVTGGGDVDPVNNVSAATVDAGATAIPSPAPLRRHDGLARSQP